MNAVRDAGFWDLHNLLKHLQNQGGFANYAPTSLYDGEVCSIVQDVIYYTHSFFAGVAKWQTQRT